MRTNWPKQNQHRKIQTQPPQGSSLPVPAASTYLNDPTPAHLKGYTKDGDGDVGRGRIVMGPADVITVVFEGGVVGSNASAGLDGTYETER